MSANGFRAMIAAACLAAFTLGCRSMLSVPEHVKSDPDYQPNADRDQYDGWLFRRLTGQEQSKEKGNAIAKAPDAASRAAADTTVAAGSGQAVKQASATEPVTPSAPEPSAPAVSSRAYPSPSLLEDENPPGLDVTDFYPSTIYKRLKVAAGYGPDEKIAREAYAHGMDLFRQKKFKEAQGPFATAADRWPDTPLEEDALFMLAESQFYNDEYSKAEDTYEKLLKKYEYSRYLDKAVAKQFAIGRYWEEFHKHEPHWPVTPNFFDKTRPMFDTWGYGLKAYEHVRLNDPTGPLADDSLMATATAHYIRGQYDEASSYYDMLRKEFPKSEHSQKAHLLSLESKGHIYSGPMYDPTPLKEAGEVADQTLLRFGNTLGKDKERVIDAKNRIVEQKAEREWAIAEYYDRNRYYGAARLHYQDLVKDYPQTQQAEAARQRLEEIKDLPANPPNHFKWISDILDPKKKRLR